MRQYVALDREAEKGFYLKLVDSVISKMDAKVIGRKAVWNAMKAEVGVIPTTDGTILIDATNDTKLVFTESSFMDNVALHHAAKYDKEVLEALLKAGKFILTGFSGETSNMSSTFGAMVSKGFFWSSIQKKTELPKGSSFEEVYDQVSEEFASILSILYDLGVKYGYGAGEWTKGPFESFQEIFNPEELKELGMTPEESANRTFALERMEICGWTSERQAEKFKRYNYGVQTQHYCKDVYSA